MSEKLRRLKDEAAKLVQRGKLDKALEAYSDVALQDPSDLASQLKCGDLLRKLQRPADAIAAYMRVAQTYAADGQLLKAIAACKLITEIEPQHTATQQMLADLYAKKSGIPIRPASAAAPVAELDVASIDIDTEEPVPQTALPTIPLLSDLPQNAFIALMEQMKMRQVLPDEAIIVEGEVDDSMFIISSGQVKVTKTSESGSEVILARLGDGAFFGEMALLSESPRIASVIAVEETLLFQVSREILGDVSKSFPSVSSTMLKFYRQRLLANLMATSPIFRPLEAEQRKRLMEKFKSREVAAHQTLLEAGQPGDGLYMLLTGRAEVVKQVGGKDKVVAHLREGEVFGEMSLLENAPVSARVKTLRKSIVLKLSRQVFGEIVAAHPQLLAQISQIKSEREKTNDAIMQGKLMFSDEGLVVV